MLLSSLVSLLTDDGVTFELTFAAFLVLFLGVFIMLLSRNHSKQIQKREGYIVVSFGWVLMSLSGMLPYLFSGVIPDVSSAFFETMSGYTTTGSSVLNDIESLPMGILFWRSTTHWIGGMGIIVLAIAILLLFSHCAFILLEPSKMKSILILPLFSWPHIILEKKPRHKKMNILKYLIIQFLFVKMDHINNHLKFLYFDLKHLEAARH